MVSIFYKVNLYTVLSTCNEVTFPANIYFLLCYFVRNHGVTESRNVRIILYVSVLGAGYAASVIAVHSVVVS